MYQKPDQKFVGFVFAFDVVTFCGSSSFDCRTARFSSGVSVGVGHSRPHCEVHDDAPMLQPLDCDPSVMLQNASPCKTARASRLENLLFRAEASMLCSRQ
eukprot:s10133_g3.t1